MTTPPHIPTGTLQCSNCHTNTAASFTTYTMNHAAVTGIACSDLPQRLVHQPGHVRRASQGHGPRRHHGGLLDLPQEHDQLGRRHLHARRDRYQLLELPQRHDRDRHDDAAAHSDRHAPVQQLPRQYGGELHHLYDEPHGGERHAVQLLSQRRPIPARAHPARRPRRAGHVATTADCSTCHKSTTSFAGASFAHAATDTNCSSCHNGTTATGMTTPPHIPTGDAPVQQLPRQYGGELHQLHDEPYGGDRHRRAAPATAAPTPARAPRARRPRAPGHVATTAECSTCHKSTTTWAGATFAHAATDTNCSSCHNGTTATGMTTPPHIPTGDAPVQQLPRQYGGELHHLHDEPHGGDRHRLQLLPQRRLYQPGHLGRAGHDNAAAYPDDDHRLQQLPHQHDELHDCHDEPLGR